MIFVVLGNFMIYPCCFGSFLFNTLSAPYHVIIYVNRTIIPDINEFNFSARHQRVYHVVELPLLLGHLWRLRHSRHATVVSMTTTIQISHLLIDVFPRSKIIVSYNRRFKKLFIFMLWMS